MTLKSPPLCFPSLQCLAGLWQRLPRKVWVLVGSSALGAGARPGGDDWHQETSTHKKMGRLCPSLEEQGRGASCRLERGERQVVPAPGREWLRSRVPGGSSVHLFPNFGCHLNFGIHPVYSIYNLSIHRFFFKLIFWSFLSFEGCTHGVWRFPG